MIFLRNHYEFGKDFSVSYHSKSPNTERIGQSVTIHANDDNRRKEMMRR